jgi:hypothetical protein
MKNDRHYRRYAVRWNGSIVDRACREFNFQVNNISACGMNITTGTELKDTEHTLTIHFDAAGIVLPRAKILKGTVVRTKQTGNTFNYSIRFQDLTHMECVEIDEYLRYMQSNPLNVLRSHEDSDDLIVTLR